MPSASIVSAGAKQDLIEVIAPCQAAVMMILVDVGARVAAGEEVALLESMKMSISILAPAAGIVRKICVCEAELVDQGYVLMLLKEDKSVD